MFTTETQRSRRTTSKPLYQLHLYLSLHPLCLRGEFPPTPNWVRLAQSPAGKPSGPAGSIQSPKTPRPLTAQRASASPPGPTQSDVRLTIFRFTTEGSTYSLIDTICTNHPLSSKFSKIQKSLTPCPGESSNAAQDRNRSRKRRCKRDCDERHCACLTRHGACIAAGRDNKMDFPTAWLQRNGISW